MRPIVVGGVGGSGTRVVAAALRTAGIFIGHDLNRPLDNLTFSLLFNRPKWWARHRSLGGMRIRSVLRLFANQMTTPHQSTRLALESGLAILSHSQHNRKWRAERLRSTWAATLKPHGRWGWKSPISHLYLPELDQALGVRYVHVIRNGLDMAIARNQLQPTFWSDVVGVKAEGLVGPRRSLRYWYTANMNALNYGAGMRDRFLLLRYEDLCSNAEQEMARLMRFIEVDVDPKALASLVSPSSKVGRYSRHPRLFLEEDRHLCAELGYTT